MSTLSSATPSCLAIPSRLRLAASLVLLPLALGACAARPPNVVMVQPQPVMVLPQQVVGQPQAGQAGLGALPPSIARAFPDQGNAFTPHPGRAPSPQELAAVGEQVSVNNGMGACDVDMVLNRDQFIANIPRLQSVGMLNQQITPQIAQAQILSVAMAFSVQASTMVSHFFLERADAPFACHFRQAITIPGPAGPQLLPMFEFDMTRAVDQQAPWPRLLTAGFSFIDANQFVSAVPSFQLAPGVVQRIREENVF